MTWWSDAAGLGSAVFTAGAAGAAWQSVRQGQRLWRSSLEADLVPQVLLNTGTGTTDLAIFNAGGGVARGTVFALASGGMKAVGHIGDGFLRGGQKVYVHAALPQTEDAECVVMWRNVDESSWAVSRQSPKVRLRRRRKGRVTNISEAWQRFYPDGPDYGSMPRTADVKVVEQ